GGLDRVGWGTAAALEQLNHDLERGGGVHRHGDGEALEDRADADRQPRGGLNRIALVDKKPLDVRLLLGSFRRDRLGWHVRDHIKGLSWSRGGRPIQPPGVVSYAVPPCVRMSYTSSSSIRCASHWVAREPTYSPFR